jgi:hypothetical protein
VLLFVEERLDGEAVDREGLVGLHPGPDRVDRDGQDLGVEPRTRLLLAREGNLHLLPSGVRLVVALVLVVVERRVVPNAVAEGADIVHRP